MVSLLILTDDAEVDGVADRGCRADLTLVCSRVLPLGVAYPEGPVLGVRGVYRLEPLVTRVRVPAHRQQMDVLVSDPGHLRQIYRLKYLVCAK